MQIRRIPWSPMCRGVTVGIILSALLPRWSAAESITSSWESLPEEAIVAFRIPTGQGFAEALARNTKFGAVLLGDKTKAEVAKVLESDGTTAWSRLQELLEAYGLASDDLIGLLAGESGYAVVMTQPKQTSEESPIFSGLGWLEPGEELASRVYEVIAQLIDEQDEEQPITRVDFTLADRPVMQLSVPAMEIEYENEFDVGDAYDELPPGEKRAAWEKAFQQWQESAVERIVYRTVLVCTLHDRLLIAHNYRADAEDASLAAAEQLSALFAEWIAAHATGADGLVTRLADDAGAARVMALEGLPAFELLGDVTPWVGLLRASAPTEEKAEQLVRILGLDGLGPFAMRSTLQGTQWSTNVSLAAPTPRQGLLQLLDQEPLAVDPSQWVPASAVRYYQWSFDLGKAYEIIKAEAMREFPGQLAGGIAMAETYVQNLAQASLSEVLSSLGNRHTIMSFGIESGGAAPENNDDDNQGNDDDNDGDGDGEADHSVASERLACVWQVEDEVLWSRLFKALTPLAGMAPGTEFSEEQGFSGWRMKQGANEGALFLGKGYLALGIGSGVIESMLSSLNNPPVGTDALRGGQVFVSANTMIDLEPALAVEIRDGNRYLSMLIGVLEKQLQQIAMLFEDVDLEDEGDISKMILPLVRAILPSQDEGKGMMGVMVSRWEVNDDGIFGESVQELPAP